LCTRTKAMRCPPLTLLACCAPLTHSVTLRATATEAQTCTFTTGMLVSGSAHSFYSLLRLAQKRKALISCWKRDRLQESLVRGCPTCISSCISLHFPACSPSTHGLSFVTPHRLLSDTSPCPHDCGGCDSLCPRHHCLCPGEC
jgi:regulation of enolase protein 1 (concanavalin A-like superfamily)